MSKTELMTYYYSDLKQCASQVKTLNSTVTKKEYHWSSATEVKKIQETCYNKTHDYNFNYEYSSIETYFKAAYNYKKYKKSELDTMLKCCIRSLQNELNAIIACGESGEVNLIYD